MTGEANAGPPREPRWWVRHALAGALLLMFGGVLLGVANTRGVDGDEPFYAAAIHNVARGKRLYADFFHPQGPIQPLLYATFYRLGFHGIRALRSVSVGCCFVTGLVWWRLLTRLMPRLAAAPLCLLAVALADGAFFGWGASLKTYPLTTMLTALGSYAWWEGFRHSQSRQARVWFALAGFAWALAAGARTSFAGPVLLLSLILLARTGWFFATRKQWLLEDLVAWCAGAGAGAAITAYQWLRAPEAFWFDNVTAQRLREVPPKGWARLEYLFYTVHDEAIQYPWLVFIIVAGSASALALAFGARGGDSRQRADLSLVAIPGAGVAYLTLMLGLHPQYAQYYEGSLGAFFVPCLLACVARHAQALPAGAFVLSTGLVLSISARPLPNATGDVGRLDVTESVARFIAKNSRPEDQVWGYHAFWAFQSGRSYVNGAECQFGFVVAHQISARKRRRLHLLSVGELADLFARQVPKIAVKDAGTWVLQYSPSDAKRFEQELKRHYRVILDRNGIQVWLRNDATAVPE
jgi:hypothetical protein